MMKKICLLLGLLSATLSAGAQTLNVVVGDVVYAMPAAEAGEMVYADGKTVSIMNRAFAVDEISQMYIDYTPVEYNTVSIAFNNQNATATVAGNIAQYVDVSIVGADVSVVQHAEVGDATCGEITYVLRGTSADGSFRMEGAYKATVEADGLTLACLEGAAIDIQNGKRIDFKLADATVNTLTDGAGGSQKGCLSCKGHLELKGGGTLNINANTAHGIFAKEYITLKNATVNVLQAAKDGINCNQYFRMESGELNVSGVGDDGLQVSFKDETEREAEDTGEILIDGGKMTVAVTGVAAKALKADGNIIVTDGTLDLSTTGGGAWDETDQKTKSAACLSADANIRIDGGAFTMKSTGSGGKGISCDSTLTINNGNVAVTTTGGLYAYVNGTEYSSYTGNSDNLSTNQKSSPKGIKADGDVVINGGNISVEVSGNGGEGIESKNELSITGGTVCVNSYDDGLNSASHLYIKGGDITVVATNNDALDSNGNLYVSGGTTRAFGGSQPETGIDANTEQGYATYFTGGTVLAVGGGSNSAPTSSQSTQCYVTGSGSITAGATVSLSNGTETLATFTVPENYKSSSGSSGGRPGWGGGPGGSSSGGLLITCGGLTKGSSYTLTVGSTSSSVSAAQYGGSSRPR